MDPLRHPHQIPVHLPHPIQHCRVLHLHKVLIPSPHPHPLKQQMIIQILQSIFSRINPIHSSLETFPYQDCLLIVSMEDEHGFFEQFFGEAKHQYQIFSPYRICPIGAHSDHQHGVVLGLAIDNGIHIFASANDSGKIELVSMDFEGIVGFSTLKSIGDKQNNWGDYIKGAVISLKRSYDLPRGVKGVIKGSMPVGGLSSSAALLVGFIKLITKVNSIQLSDLDLINFSSYAEREYIGLRNGILDQSCITLCKKNKLLYLDTKTQAHHLLNFSQNHGEGLVGQDTNIPFEIGIYFSGVTRKLTETNFNMRVTECKVSAWMLSGYQGLRLGDLEDARLRYVDEEVFHKHKGKMPESFRKRATHFYTQFNRVHEGVEAWKQGDVEKFGKLMFESCESSVVNYECASPELIAIYQIMKSTDGVYGGRFSGAGFKGACMSIVDPRKKKQIEETMTQEYLKRFPQYKDSFKVFFCKSADGITLTTHKPSSPPK